MSALWRLDEGDWGDERKGRRMGSPLAMGSMSLHSSQAPEG